MYIVWRLYIGPLPSFIAINTQDNIAYTNTHCDHWNNNGKDRLNNGYSVTVLYSDEPNLCIHYASELYNPSLI